jgi:CheY-like chemotaxis protein
MPTPGQPLILIVDDEPDFREIFSKGLSAAGFATETAENGADSILKAKSLKPNLILMDVNMPVMDGPTAVIKLREDPATKDTKIAFLTNLGDPRAELRTLDQKFSEQFGVREYLKKTDDLSALVEQIRAMLA